jgi:CBS domain-containing protein
MPERSGRCASEVPVAAEMRSSAPLELGDTELTIEDIMSEAIVSAEPDETILAVARRMSEHNISCIVVTTGDKAVGVLTERDVLRGVANRDDLLTSTVSEKMSSPVVAVAPDMSALEASALMESKGIKRLAVTRDQHLVGVVTQTDITRGLISMSPFRNIADLMTADVVTIDATTTITEAAKMMAARNISCVVLMHRDEAAGIVTEKDILQRVVACNGDATTIPAAEIMSFPVVTVPPSYSVMSATRMMDDMHIHRLVIGRSGKVHGIVTQTDIISAVRRKVQEARALRLRHKSEIGCLADSAMGTLSSIQGLVGRARGRIGAEDEAAALSTTLEALETQVTQLHAGLESLAKTL